MKTILNKITVMKIKIIAGALGGDTCSFHRDSSPKSFLIWKNKLKTSTNFCQINADQLLSVLVPQVPSMCWGRVLSFENMCIFKP